MNAIVQVDNPFGGAGGDMIRPGGSGGAAAASDQSRAIAEVQAGLVVARQFPRNQMQAAERIRNACQRRGLAERAIYEYVKGGTQVTGPSIRLAEAIAQEWGNLSFGMRVLEQNDDMSSVKAFCWDLETNVRREIDFQVSHFIKARGAMKRITDPYELQANLGQRRTRACILAVIPGDIIDMALDQCDETLRANEDCSAQGIKKMVDAFAKNFGVTAGQIETKIQRRLDTMQPAQKVGLRRIYNSLNDGMSQPEDWFEPLETGEVAAKPASGNAAAKAALKGAAAKKSAEPKTDPAPAAQAGDGTLSPDNPAAGEGPADSQTGEANSGAEEANEPSMAQRAVDIARAGVAHAKTATYLDGIERDWINVRAVVDDETAAEIDALISAKRRDLRAA